MFRRLEFGDPLGAGFLRLLRAELDDTLRAAIRRRPANAACVHELRKHGKRLRALFRLLRPLDRRMVRRANRLLRDGLHPLSAVRDADTLVATFDALAAHFEPTWDRARMAGLRRRLLARRRIVRPAPAHRGLLVRKLVARLRRVRGIIPRRWPEGSAADDLAAALQRSYARARRAFARARRHDSTDALHAWRKHVKALRCQLQPLRAARPEVMKALAHELAKLGDLLGEEHDLAMLRRELRRVAQRDDPPAGIVRELIATRRRELRAEARALGVRVFAARPAAFARRILDWWERARAATPA